MTTARPQAAEGPSASVGVVIVGFNSSATIESCIRSCLGDSAVRSVVVVDNAGQARCQQIVTEVAEADSRVTYHASENVGFGRACNVGVGLLPSCDTLVFLNPDVELSRPLSELATLLARTTHCIVSGRLVTGGSPNQVNVRPLVSMRRELRSAVLGSVRGYALPAAAGWQPGQVVAVEQLAGALMVISTRDFRCLGGFDEQFELYYDDVDLSARARALGGSALVNEEWGVHHGGVSSATIPGLAFCVGSVSRVRYLRKAYGDRALVSLGVAAIACAELIVRSVTRRPEGHAARWRAVAMQMRELHAPGSVSVLK